MSNLFSKSGNTLSITLNIPLLWATIGVAFAAMILRLMATAAALSFVVLALLLTLIYVAYAVYQLFRQAIVAWREQHAAPEIATSACLGSFLMGLIATSFADATAQSFLPGVVGLLISIVSLLGLLFFISNQPASPKTSPEEKSPTGQVPSPSPAAPTPTQASTNGRAISVPEKPIDSVKLPPLFVNDPLHSFPKFHQSRFFSVAKNNDLPVRNEDACVISEGESRFALCDGASGSNLPRPWATLLGQQWIKNPLYTTERPLDADTLSRWLAEPRQSWAAWVQNTWQHTINERNREIGKAPVSSSQMGVILNERGAAATLLGLEINRQKQWWLATAIGDTCLFIIQEGRIRPIIPITRSRMFNDTPPLLSSLPNSRLDYLLPYIKLSAEKYQSGDVLFMATDTLAEWLVRQAERKLSGWSELLSINDPQSFTQFVKNLYEHNLLEKDDDISLVRIPL